MKHILIVEDELDMASIVVAPLRTIAADNNSLLIIFKVLYR